MMNIVYEIFFTIDIDYKIKISLYIDSMFQSF